MADLYDRLEEIQGMTRVLTRDVSLLGQSLGDRSISVAVTEAQEAGRRSYVRAVFALVEAVIEQHKRLLLDLDDRGLILLAPGLHAVLSEREFGVKDNGTVMQRERYLDLLRKVRAVYRAASDVFGQTLNVRFDAAGWVSFRSAIQVRDRITHPKSFQDCDVDAGALNAVDQGHAWFRELNNEFVRIARVHRQQHHW